MKITRRIPVAVLLLALNLGCHSFMQPPPLVDPGRGVVMPVGTSSVQAYGLAGMGICRWCGGARFERQLSREWAIGGEGYAGTGAGNSDWNLLVPPNFGAGALQATAQYTPAGDHVALRFGLGAGLIDWRIPYATGKASLLVSTQSQRAGGLFAAVNLVTSGVLASDSRVENTLGVPWANRFLLSAGPSLGVWWRPAEQWQLVASTSLLAGQDSFSLTGVLTVGYTFGGERPTDGG